MASDVRLRGEVGERRVGIDSGTGDWPERREHDRRESASIAARVNEIIAHLQAERAVECAGLERRIAELTLQLNQHADEVIALRLNLGHLEAENARLRLLAAGAGAGAEES